jgi:hypothetical protein
MATHIHHIIPRHMGGTDNLENLVELTVEEHAEAHRKLYEEHGHWQDYLAYRALSGQIKSDEIRRLKTILSWTGRKHTKESKEKIRQARSKQIMHPCPEERKQKISQSLAGHLVSDDTKKKISEKTKGKPKSNRGQPKRKIDCPHCGKTGAIAMMYRWHFDNCKLKEQT